jgi:ABC-type transport system involved in multi-copper enzyme maturation permease subunit
VSATGPTKTPAAIHDLGYKRYVGTRRPQRSRYRVIVHNVVAMTWRGWWRGKMWLISTAIAAFITGAFMYVSQNKLFKGLLAQGSPVTWADALIPLSFEWFTKIAFILTVTVAAGLVARDLRAGAFEFYFSRPVRPIDYVLGKVGGVAVVMGIVLVVAPVLLSLFRLGLSADTGELVGALVLVPKTAAVGLIATLGYAVVPVAIGAITGNPRHAVAAWVGFYFVLGASAGVVALQLDMPVIAAIDLQSSVMAIAVRLFHLSFTTREVLPPAWAAMTALVGYPAAGLALLYWRVSRAERAGLGGG